MPGAHNIWSPSKLERNMKCPGSVNLHKIEGVNEVDEGDDEANKPWLAEGTLAHAVCEALLLGQELPEGYTEEMLNHGQDFYDYVMSLDPDRVIVEEKLVHPDHPEFGGTPDVLVIKTVGGRTQLHTVDYKYGKGMRVNAEGNYQLRGYLVLAMREHGAHDSYFGHIFQPRLGGLSFDKWTHDDILGFEGQLKTAMTETKLVPGDHCRWCPALATCAAVRANAMQAAAKAFGNDLEKPEDWKFLLDNKEAIKALLDEAPKQVLKFMRQGVTFEGYKAVAVSGRTTWNDEEEATAKLSKKFGKKKVTRTKLMTPNQLKKEGIDPEAIDKLSSRTISGLTVVKESDKRSSIDVNPTDGFTKIN